MSKRNHWYDYLWVLTALYLALGFLIFFSPGWDCCAFSFRLSWLLHSALNHIAINTVRGQLFELIGNSWKLSPKRDILLDALTYLPLWLLAVFTTMFVNMLVSTYLVFTHAIYFHKTVSLLWTLTYHGTGLTAAVRSHGSRNLLLDFTASC